MLLSLMLWAPDRVFGQIANVQNGIPDPSIATSLPRNGDPAGYRKWLGDHGVVYNLIYTNDTLSNVSGGLRRGTINQGKLETIVTADLGKLAGLNGLQFYANSFQIHNTGRMRRDYVGGVNTLAAIEAEVQYHPAGSLDEARKQAAEALVIRELLLQEASRRGVDGGTPEDTIAEIGRAHV